MSPKPVLVVHGIANHDRQVFEQRVATLQQTIRPQLPDVQLIPVFWGDLGGRSENIRDCLPQLTGGKWTTRAEDVLTLDASGPAVRTGPALSNDERARIIAVAAAPAAAVRGAPDATRSAVAAALGETRYLQMIEDPALLEAVGEIVGEALGDALSAAAAGTYEVRGAEETAETRGWVKDKVKGVIHGIDKLVGRLVEDRLGALNQRLRGSLMGGVAATLGDIVAYQGNKRAIQQRLWDAIAAHAPGYGSQARPIGVVAHSLGGVISFDAMVAPAGGAPLYVNSFVTFGSQPAFFEIVDPRGTGSMYRTGHPITLPTTIGKWFNLWDVVDLLAFTAGTVFRLSDGSTPEDIPVEDPISVMLDERLWLHSVYWRTPELKAVLEKTLG